MKLSAASLAGKRPCFQSIRQLAENERLEKFNSFVPLNMVIFVQQTPVLRKCCVGYAQSSGDLTFGHVSMM